MPFLGILREPVNGMVLPQNAGFYAHRSQIHISPVLFILFINDLLFSTSSSMYSFADDIYLSSSFSSNSPNLSHSNVSSYRNTSASLLTNDLSTIEMWGNDNRVMFNHGKTTQVVISSKHHQDFPLYS